jgi:hypothetical protein
MSIGAQLSESRALCRWVSHILCHSATHPIEPKDFKNGLLLIRLVERLFNESIDPSKYCTSPKNDNEMTMNHNCVLEFVRSKGVFADRGCSVQRILSHLFFKCQTHLPPARPDVSDDPLLAWVQRFLVSENIDPQLDDIVVKRSCVLHIDVTSLPRLSSSEGLRSPFSCWS